jgi:hypothetical protein
MALFRPGLAASRASLTFLRVLGLGF